ncbi:MAG: T9SS type A sorting domain-containing protein [Bacteroidota bacterium]
MNNKSTRYACAPPAGSIHRLRHGWRLPRAAAVMILMMLIQYGSAQNLIINGSVTNTGKIRVKNQTTIAQSAVGGELELKGADQILPAKQYGTVRLTGTGTKSTTGGNFTIQQSLTIAAAVTLQMPKGNIITLGDTLFESGIFNGAIQKTVNLTGSTTSSNFGNIGAAITWTSNAPGITNVLRVSDSIRTGNGNESIKRFYQIQPTDATATGTIVLKYSDSELNGHRANNLQLWRSSDGINWQRQVPVVDTLLKTITKTNVKLQGYWTASDTVRALGPLTNGAGIPVSIAKATAAPAQERILTTLDTLKVLITDIFGAPVQNVAVKFSVSIKPAPSSAGTLSDTNVVTNASGIASTLFTLGNKVGAYEVIAASGNLDTIRYNITARHGLAQTMAAVPISQQIKPILTPLDSLFTITVADVGGNPVDSALVQFAIVNLPSGSFGQTLSISIAQTDSSGKASTRLTLGSKTATYSVRAKVNGITDSATFTAQAIAGPPATIARNSGDGQSGVNGQALSSPFVVTVLDEGGNPVNGDTVEFKLQANAFGAVLSKSIVPTDALGQASSILTLGTRSGPYAVSARSHSLVGSLQFIATAQPGAAATLAQIQGNNQSAPIGTVLGSDLVVHILDANGNSVPNDTVFFSIDSLPNVNATGMALTNSSVITDTSGLATTKFTLGNKTGDYIVNARVRNIPVVSFRVNAKAGAATLFADLSGLNQTAVIATPLPNEFAMRVADIGGNSVAGTTVQFTITSAPANAVGQRLSTASSVSDVNGFARTTFTLGNKVGTYTIRASSAGIPDTVFTVTATHGPASAMMVSSGLGQTRPILTSLDSFSVKIVDIGENAVPLKNVQFSIIERPAGDTSASLSSLASGSDASGIAAVRLTLGSKIGAYKVKATITTPAPFESQQITGKNGKGNRSEASVSAAIETTFSAIATYGTAAVFTDILGDKQLKPTETTLDTSFVVTVKDIGGNRVPNANVKFAITSVPSNATGQRLKDTLVTTDSLGVASTVLTLGSREGLYTVAASVNGSLSTLFAANAFYIYGDPNNDVNINVADITTIIDQIIGKRTFSFLDSLKADLNKDGLIDTADVNVLARTILDRPSLFSTLPPFIPERASAKKKDGEKASSGERSFFADAKTQFEATPQGLRLNMENTVPVRGLEVRIRLKDSTVVVNNSNYLFARAQQMNVVMKTVNNELRMLAYSLLNEEIQPGTGTVIRIPKIISVSQFDSTQVLLSVGGNVAVTPEAIVVTAVPGKYPTTYSLEQNYPNPFNGLTTIQYEIPDQKTTETKIAIQIFNVLGQKVKTLINTPHDPGQYRVTWNGTDESGSQVSSGIYFYRLITKNHLTTKKMIYVK